MLPVLDDYNFPSVPSGNQGARNLTHFCTYCNCLKEPVQDKVKNQLCWQCSEPYCRKRYGATLTHYDIIDGLASQHFIKNESLKYLVGAEYEFYKYLISDSSAWTEHFKFYNPLETLVISQHYFTACPACVLKRQDISAVKLMLPPQSKNLTRLLTICACMYCHFMWCPTGYYYTAEKYKSWMVFVPPYILFNLSIIYKISPALIMDTTSYRIQFIEDEDEVGDEVPNGCFPLSEIDQVKLVFKSPPPSPETVQPGLRDVP